MCACSDTHTCVVSTFLFSVPALGLHLISKFILKVCHLSCELLLGFCSGVERGVEIGEKRGREAEGGGADNRGGGRRRAVNEGGGVWCTYVGHSSSHAFLCFLPLFLITSAIIPSLSPGCWVYLGGLAL